MAIFKVNTGCREQEVCQLQWKWEIRVPALNINGFIIPSHIVQQQFSQFGGWLYASGSPMAVHTVAPAPTVSVVPAIPVVPLALPTLAPSSASKATPSETASTWFSFPEFSFPKLSMPSQETLIGAQWGLHYLQKASRYMVSHSPYTLPKNRPHPLTDESISKLKEYQKQLAHFERVIATQKASRLGRHPLFQDMFHQVDQNISEIKSTIETAFKTKKISRSNLDKTAKLGQSIQKSMHQLPDYNRQLKQSNVKTRRKIAKALDKGEKPAVRMSRDAVNGTCKQEVVTQNTFLGWSRFSMLLQDRRDQSLCAISQAAMPPVVKEAQELPHGKALRRLIGAG